VKEGDDRHLTDSAGLERDLTHDERCPRANRRERRGLEPIHDSACVVDAANTRVEIELVRRRAQLAGIGGNQEAWRETHRNFVTDRRVAVEVQENVHGEHRARLDLGRRIRNRVRGHREGTSRISHHACEGQCCYQFLP
jgi:hypothetical protein